MIVCYWSVNQSNPVQDNQSTQSKSINQSINQSNQWNQSNPIQSNPHATNQPTNQPTNTNQHTHTHNTHTHTHQHTHTTPTHTHTHNTHTHTDTPTHTNTHTWQHAPFHSAPSTLFSLWWNSVGAAARERDSLWSPPFRMMMTLILSPLYPSFPISSFSLLLLLLRPFLLCPSRSLSRGYWYESKGKESKVK